MSKNDHELFFHQSLYDEKMKHKEYRFKYVTNKITFASTTFVASFTFAGFEKSELSLLLLLVPIICFAIDFQIVAEDYRIKRIGTFIKKSSDFDIDFLISDVKWEKYLSGNNEKNRERYGGFTPFILSIMLCIVSIICIFDIYYKWKMPKTFINSLPLFFLVALSVITNIIIIITSIRYRRIGKDE